MKEDAPEAINAIAVNKDATLLASGGAQLKIWDVSDAHTPKVCRVLTGHEVEINGVAFSPSGGTLASASNDETVRMWNAATGEQRTVLSGHEGPVLSVAWSCDSRMLASGGGGNDRGICLWDAAAGTLVMGPLKGHGGGVVCMAFNADGDELASGSLDRTVKIWGLKGSGVVKRTLAGHAGAVNSISYSPDYRFLVSASADRTL
jgi:WD40 repeat protein